MATTVTYKGQTLTTVDNDTKVLETAGTWVEDDFTLTDVSGGGGDSSPLTKLETVTLSENVRNVRIDIESDWRTYDALMVAVDVTFAGSDWLYWNIDATTLDSGKYMSQAISVVIPYYIASVPSGATKMVAVNSASYAVGGGTYPLSSIQYLFFSGYAKDMLAGSSFTVWGYNYADLR